MKVRDPETGTEITLGIAGFHGSGEVITWVSPPSSASAVGTPGMVARDSNFLYVCVASNTWKRAAFSLW